MNVAPVKSGKRGRPRFRRFVGVLELRELPGFLFHWAFTSHDLDLFVSTQVKDSCLVFISESDLRKLDRVAPPCDGKFHVEVAFTGRSGSVPGSVLPRFEVRILRVVA